MFVGYRHSNFIPLDGFEKLKILLDRLGEYEKIPYIHITIERNMLRLGCTEGIAQNQF